MRFFFAFCRVYNYCYIYAITKVDTSKNRPLFDLSAILLKFWLKTKFKGVTSPKLKFNWNVIRIFAGRLVFVEKKQNNADAPLKNRIFSLSLITSLPAFKRLNFITHLLRTRSKRIMVIGVANCKLNDSVLKFGILSDNRDYRQLIW